MRDKRQTWQVRYEADVLGREIGTREEAISLACAELDRGDVRIEALLGPNYAVISRAELERECERRRAKS
jgi:hypothetical protein